MSRHQCIRFAAGQVGTYFFVQNCRMALRLLRRVIVGSAMAVMFAAEVYYHAYGGR